jgi:hypothetical protein
MPSTRNQTTTRLPSVRRRSRSTGRKALLPKARLLEIADELERLALRREKVLELRDRPLAERARSLAFAVRRFALRTGDQAQTSDLIDEWTRLEIESTVLLDPGVSSERST